MAVAAVAAVVGAIAAVAGTAAGIAGQVKASKESEKMRKMQQSMIKSEQAATDIERRKVADLAGQGGMTAGQYSRALMQDDTYAMQAQGLSNKIEQQSVFGDAFRKEAFYKLALSDIKSTAQKTTGNLADMDANMIVQNAQLAMTGAHNLRISESAINQELLSAEMLEIERKTKIMENVSKGIASTAQLVGAGVKYYGEQNKPTTPTANTLDNTYNPYTPKETLLDSNKLESSVPSGLDFGLEFGTQQKTMTDLGHEMGGINMRSRAETDMLVDSYMSDIFGG
jgi:hypothetical protein